MEIVWGDRVSTGHDECNLEIWSPYCVCILSYLLPGSVTCPGLRNQHKRVTVYLGAIWTAIVLRILDQLCVC
jgi:hypothetical protein